MSQYTVEIKNISARVDKMTVPPGETRLINVRTNDPDAVLQSAVKQAFNGCRFASDGKNADGSYHGQVTTGKMLYGRIYIYVHPSA